PPPLVRRAVSRSGIPGTRYRPSASPHVTVDGTVPPSRMGELKLPPDGVCAGLDGASPHSGVTTIRPSTKRGIPMTTAHPVPPVRRRLGRFAALAVAALAGLGVAAATVTPASAATAPEFLSADQLPPHPD